MSPPLRRSMSRALRSHFDVRSEEVVTDVTVRRVGHEWSMTPSWRRKPRSSRRPHRSTIRPSRTRKMLTPGKVTVRPDAATPMMSRPVWVPDAVNCSTTMSPFCDQSVHVAVPVGEDRSEHRSRRPHAVAVRSCPERRGVVYEPLVEGHVDRVEGAACEEGGDEVAHDGLVLVRCGHDPMVRPGHECRYPNMLGWHRSVHPARTDFSR